jgi:hypothetical protein
VKPFERFSVDKKAQSFIAQTVINCARIENVGVKSYRERERLIYGNIQRFIIVVRAICQSHRFGCARFLSMPPSLHSAPCGKFGLSNLGNERI